MSDERLLCLSGLHRGKYGAQDFQNHAIAQKKVVFHLGGW